MQLNVVGILQFIVNNEKNGDFSKDKKWDETPLTRKNKLYI